jgi:hypothetical protein
MNKNRNIPLLASLNRERLAPRYIFLSDFVVIKVGYETYGFFFSLLKKKKQLRIARPSLHRVLEGEFAARNKKE